MFLIWFMKSLLLFLVLPVLNLILFCFVDKATLWMHLPCCWSLCEGSFVVLLSSYMFWLYMVACTAMFHLQTQVESFFKRALDIFLYPSVFFLFFCSHNHYPFAVSFGCLYTIPRSCIILHVCIRLTLIPTSDEKDGWPAVAGCSMCFWDNQTSWVICLVLYLLSSLCFSLWRSLVFYHHFFFCFLFHPDHIFCSY